ncbi:hypothetical protein L1280_002794 [Deinococcus sp. HSC-46F16]|uniref:hypothetical protein n=1 Tax=Deinococcus sp. HSC-46F16 TaxID=2910968 RepID=UPI0020A1FC2D|nr:hypothetical protein [Deinococcus sp. HSC-46F16]MCP2015626.1 hypothetical protein [Deinococcus sp. HSC-46F16]
MGKATELARQREREAYEATRLAQLAPTDPIRRAKVLDGVPAPQDGGAPNGTAGKAGGADGEPIQGGASEGTPTPEHIPEVQPTTAQDSRPAKQDDAPGLSNSEAEAAAVAQPDEKPKTSTKSTTRKTTTRKATK